MYLFESMQEPLIEIAWMAVATAAGGAIGWTLDAWVLGRLRRLAFRSDSPMDDLLLHALRGAPMALCALAGLRLVARWRSMDPVWGVPMAHITLALAVLVFCMVAARALSGWLLHLTSGLQQGSRSASILGIVVRAVIFSIGALVILNDLGISIAPMVTALGVGGLAVALALQDTLSNLFAGIQLLASRQLSIGDFVKLETGEEGYLMDITWRNTTVRALANHIIVIPNAKLASTVIHNHQLPDPEVAVLLEVGVSYDSDLEHVERVTIETARAVVRRMEPGLNDFDPFIRYNAFAESSVNFSVILRAREFTGRYELVHEFMKALHRCFRTEGIVIPYPMRTINVNIPELVHDEH